MCCASASLPGESVFSYSFCSYLLLAMPGRGKRANRIAKPRIEHVYKYFEKGSAKSKCRVPPKLASRTAEATGYSERAVRKMVAEKSEISGAAFASPPKRCRKNVIPDDFNTEALRQLVQYFYREKNAL